MEQGNKFCKHSHSVSEEKIKELIREKLGMDTFDENQIKNLVDTILIHSDGILQIEL